MAGVDHQFGVVGEQRGKGLGKELHQRPQQTGIEQAGPQQQEIGFLHPVPLAGAVVVADDGLGALAQTLQRQHGKLHDAGQDGHGTHRQISAVLQQGRVEGHRDDALTGLHNKGSGTQRHTGKQHGRGEPDGLLAQPQEGPLAEQKGQHPDAGERLGQDGGQGSAPHSHAEQEDEDRVQHDVGHRADEHRQHAFLGEALGGDEGVHAQRYLHKEGAHRIDVHIDDRIVDGVGAGTEGQQKRPVAPKQNQRQHDRDDDLQGKAVAQDLLGLFFVALAHGDGGAGRAAVAHQGGEGGDDHDQRQADAHAGQGQGAVLGNVADVDAIHDVVQHIDQLGGHGGKCQPEQKTAKRVIGQERFVVGMGVYHSDAFFPYKIQL